jgi:hypothetical protein
MTAAGVRKLPGAIPEMPGRPLTGLTASLRLGRLYLAGRRVPSGVAALAGCGAVLWVALHLHWTLGSGTGAQSLPVVLEAGAASIITVASRSPFGEAERAAGRWLPWLRLGSSVLLIAAAVGMLAAGAAIAGGLHGGTLGLARDVAGMTGIGLLLAAVTGGGLGWIGPTAYMVVAEYALLNSWTTPLIWPGRPPHDTGGAICAGVVFAAGIIVTTIRGSRDSSSD